MFYYNNILLIISRQVALFLFKYLIFRKLLFKISCDFKKCPFISARRPQLRELYSLYLNVLNISLQSYHFAQFKTIFVVIFSG